LDVINTFDDDEIEFLAIGDPKGASDEITRQIQFLGRINKQEIMACAYSLAEIFVLPSREDNLPNTMLESLGCGTPVVGFNIGGVPDSVEHGVNGFLCTSVDAQSLKDGIKQALETDFDSLRISENAHRKYALSNQARSYVEIYEKLLS